MPEVKFQCWDTEYNQMYQNAWPFEHLVYVEISPEDAEGHRQKMFGVNGKLFYFLLSKNVVLRQYTGLNDAHKEEIYKGDILAATEMGSPIVGFVDWERDGWVVKSDKFQHGEGYEYGIGKIYSSLYQVVGNVYKHIDLLPEVLRRHAVQEG
jgi:uncharacterized phage protein (TIGR01671 family)